MNWEIKDFHPSSKIWIYTLNPALKEEQIIGITADITSFCTQWTAHNRELRSFFKIFENRILLIGVDEHLNPASGCSIDKSVHFLEEIEQKYSIEIFNRMLFSYFDKNNKLQTLTKNEFENAIAESIINTETLVINNLTLSLNDWNENGIIPLSASWMMNFFGLKI